MTVTTARRRVAIADLPDIAAPVGLHGALTRSEVGGSFCFAIVVTTARGASRPA